MRKVLLRLIVSSMAAYFVLVNRLQVFLLVVCMELKFIQRLRMTFSSNFVKLSCTRFVGVKNGVKSFSHFHLRERNLNITRFT